MFKKPTSVLYILIICISITLATQSCGNNSNSANSNNRNRTLRVHDTPPSVEEPQPNPPKPLVKVSEVKFKEEAEKFDKLFKDGGIDALKKAIENNTINLNIKDDKNNNILHHFAHKPLGDDLSKILNLLKYNGVNIPEMINAKEDQNASTPFHESIISNNLTMFELLVNNPNTELNLQDKFLRTPLHDAVLNDWGNALYFAEKLISQKNRIDLNIQDNRGNTPLHYAVENPSKIEVLRLLIPQKEINLNIKNHDNKEPFDS